jgi:hypothetical protein
MRKDMLESDWISLSLVEKLSLTINNSTYDLWFVLVSKKLIGHEVSEIRLT